MARISGKAGRWTPILARCPGHGNAFEEVSLRLPCPDERSLYHRGWGSVLVEGACVPACGACTLYHLVLSKGREGPKLHRRWEVPTKEDGDWMHG
jgi:hypothetical protein